MVVMTARRLFRFSLCCLGVLATACATPSAILPEISATSLQMERVEQEGRALRAQRDFQIRLMEVGRPVLAANAELCPKTRRDLGVILHSEGNYPEEMRLAARRVLGVRSEPSIMHVISGSPAEAAGLQIGDQILIDGESVDGAHKGLRETLEADRTTLSIRRGAETLSLDIEPAIICDVRLQLNSRSSANAKATGRTVKINRGMLEFVQSDDELAQVIGHEMAHNMLKHIRKVATTFVLSGFSKRYARPFESEADYVGLYYMVRAGYDPSNVENFWRRLATIDPISVNLARTHPTFPDRYLRLAAAREEILEKQAKGKPLIPNFKDGENPLDGS